MLTSSGGAAFFAVAPDATAITNEENIKITGFTFDAANTALIMISVTGAGSSGTKPYKYVIIGDNKFQNLNVPTSGSAAIYVSKQVRGVIYSNIFDKCNMLVRPTGNDTTTEFENSAYSPFAYGSADNLYWENNSVIFSSSFAGGDPGWIQGEQGGRIVGRFNTYNMANSSQAEVWDIHGFQNWDGTPNSGQTGMMLVEYYNNTITNASGYRLINHRGGWGMFFGNTVTGSSMSIDVNQYDNPATGGSGCPSEVNPTPVGYSTVVNNTYVFNNIIQGSRVDMTPGSIGLGCGIAANANFWNQATSFTGATGIGVGVVASRPGTCTTGVGYWATDQGSWNSSGSGGQGVFYKCTSTNTWTSYYTPYTYPHPLRGGGSGAATIGITGKVTLSGKVTVQ